jgi:ATP-dependent protease ClpP protease subunit
LVRKHSYADQRPRASSGAYPMVARVRAEGGTVRVDILDDIGGNPWTGGGMTAKSLAEQLAGTRGPVDVHLNSSGGDVWAGLSMSEALRQHPGKVTVHVDGLAASIASVIVQAGQERVMAPGSMQMLHDAWTVAEGNGGDLRRQADVLDKVSDTLAQQYAARAGGTASYWRSVMRDETWYGADEAVAAGLADRVGGSGAALPLPGAAVEPLAARAPARIAARLRVMAAGAADDGSCLTCGGWGRLKHPGTGKAGMKCPSCDGEGTYSAAVTDQTRAAVRELRRILPPLH